MIKSKNFKYQRSNGMGHGYVPPQKISQVNFINSCMKLCSCPLIFSLASSLTAFLAFSHSLLLTSLSIYLSRVQCQTQQSFVLIIFDDVQRCNYLIEKKKWNEHDNNHSNEDWFPYYNISPQRISNEHHTNWTFFHIFFTSNSLSLRFHNINANKM